MTSHLSCFPQPYIPLHRGVSPIGIEEQYPLKRMGVITFTSSSSCAAARISRFTTGMTCESWDHHDHILSSAMARVYRVLSTELRVSGVAQSPRHCQLTQRRGSFPTRSVKRKHIAYTAHWLDTISYTVSSNGRWIYGCLLF